MNLQEKLRIAHQLEVLGVDIMAAILNKGGLVGYVKERLA